MPSHALDEQFVRGHRPDPAQRFAHFGDLLEEQWVLARVGVADVAKLDGDDVGDPPGTGGHHDDAVGEEHRLGDRVGHEHDARGRLGTDAEQLRLHVLAGHLVERPEGLVHQQQLRIGGEGASDRHALLHPTGQLPGAVAGELVELDELEHLHRPLPAPGAIPALELER